MDYMARPSRRDASYGKSLATTSASEDHEHSLKPKPDRQAEQNRSTPVNPDGSYGKGSSVTGMYSNPVKGV